MIKRFKAIRIKQEILKIKIQFLFGVCLSSVMFMQCNNTRKLFKKKKFKFIWRLKNPIDKKKGFIDFWRHC